MKISRSNSTFQQLLAARTNRDARKRQDVVFVEGRAPIEAALRGCGVHSFYTRESFDDDNILRQLLASGAEHYQLSDELFGQVSQMEESTAPIVLFHRVKPTKPKVSALPSSLHLLLDRPSNPGNLGTLIRTAVAFGLESVMIIGHGCDPFDPVTISASRGAVFEIPIHTEITMADLEKLQSEYRQQASPLTFISTDSESEHSISSVNISGPRVLVLGNEKLGVSKKLQEMSDYFVSIPTAGKRASLNVACAGAILMHKFSVVRDS